MLTLAAQSADGDRIAGALQAAAALQRSWCSSLDALGDTLHVVRLAFLMLA